MDIKEFLFALTGDWVALMSGIASVAITVLGIAKKWEKVPNWVFWVAAALCFFFAAAKVWTTEHRLRIAREQELQQLTIPQLKMGIDQIAIGTAAGAIQELDGRASVFVIANLTNDGAASIAENYRLTVVLPDGSRFPDLTPFRVAQTMRFFLASHEKSEYVAFSPTDFLFDKTFEKPIEKGSRVRGVIVFAMPRGIVSDALKTAGTSFTLSCVDIKGEPIEATQVWRNAKERPKYFPGLTYPSEEPKKH